MNPQTLEAVYVDGVFRPADPKQLNLADGQKVQLVVEPIEQVDAVLELAAGVYARLSEQEIAELKCVQNEIGSFRRSRLPT